MATAKKHLPTLEWEEVSDPKNEQESAAGRGGEEGPAYTPWTQVTSTGEGCKRRQEEASLTGPCGQSELYTEAHAGLAAMEAPLTPHLTHPLLPQLPPEHLSQARDGAW